MRLTSDGIDSRVHLHYLPMLCVASSAKMLEKLQKQHPNLFIEISEDFYINYLCCTLTFLMFVSDFLNFFSAYNNSTPLTLIYTEAISFP